MSVMKKPLRLVALASAAAICCAAISPALAAENGKDAKWASEITLGGGSAGGNSRVLAGAIGRILTQKLPGVRATGAVVPGYDAESAMRTHNGTMQGGVGTPLIIKQAVDGTGPFPKEGTDLKFWFYIGDVPLNIFAQSGLNITQISGLKGKSIAMGPKGTSNYLLSKIVLNANGVKLSDLDIHYMDTSEAIKQLQNGQVDAMSYVRNYSGSVTQLTSASDITLLQPNQQAVRKISKEYPWAGPAKWPFMDKYANLKTPGKALAFVAPEFMFLSGRLSDKQVYEMTKAVWENVKVINDSSAVYRHVNLKDALKRVPIQPAVGALRYYKEQNVPGWEKYRDLLK